jgi:ribosome-associated protein
MARRKSDLHDVSGGPDTSKKMTIGAPLDHGQSRTEQKREAAEITDLGVELVALHPSELARIELDDQLIEAITICRDLPVKSRRRQERLIGQFLRTEDHTRIREGLALAGRARLKEVRSEKENEVWRDRLLQGDDDDLKIFCDGYLEVDVQHMRQLIRSARREAMGSKIKRSRRELLRLIRTLRADPE